MDGTQKIINVDPPRLDRMDYISVEVEDLLELARFAAALERLPRTILSFREEGGYLMAVLMEELEEAWAFLITRSERTGQFIMYEAGASGEIVEFVDKVRDYSASYIPVIGLAERPEFLKCKKGLIPPLKPVKVDGFTSLIKLAIYKLHYDEFPVSLYLSKEEDGLHLGAMVKITEGNGDTYYFHTKVEEAEGGFLKINRTDIRDVRFSKGIGEHGFLYIKVIKLKDKLGLV